MTDKPTTEQAMKIYERPNAVEVSRDEWLDLHRDGTHITASMVPTIMGYNRFCTPLRLWARMRGLEPWPDEAIATKIGHATESLHLELYAADANRNVVPWPQTKILRHPDIEWLACTPDAEAVDDDGLLVVECKHYGSWAADEWDDGIPLAVQAQLMTVMSCGGWERGSATALLYRYGWYHRWGDLERETAEEWLPKMVDACWQFLKCVQSGDEPPAQAVDLDVLKTLHPRHVPEKVKTFDSRWDDLFARFEECKAEMKALGTEADQLKAAIMQEFGDAEIGETPIGRRYTFKSHEVKPRLCPHCEGVVQPGRVDRVLRKKGGK